MSLLEKTKLLLRTYRISPNRLLGQNFMIDPSILQSMRDYASLDQTDVALDIGAGLGFLSRFLAEKCRSVLAVEADDRLVRILIEQLKNLPNVTVIAGNVLKTDIPPFNKVVSIPPYSISSRLLHWLLNTHFGPSVLIFQKEFANRLIAPVGSENYGWLTVLTYYQTECELLDEVPRSMFYPQPDVDSTIVCLKPRKSKPFEVRDEPLFTKLVQNLFNKRNRKVRNAVRPFLRSVLAKSVQDTEAVARNAPYSNERVRLLAPEDFGALANVLFS
jgi:16S rRNA (adenine1518-N6/adenine1519-N6)-dimethyltransferase